jgi:sigma-B regulation protein RsbU (phosphoserine phosphatase)
MCREVGGDLYHCLPRPDGRTLLVLGDVAGKGVPASLAMAATIVLIRSLNDLGTSLEEMAPHLNAQLGESLAPEQFVTLFVGELDHETGRLRYFNAGHEPPRIHRPSTDAIEELPSTGRPTAMLPFGDFGVSECTLEVGDTLAVFSDGIPEATRSGDEFFGLQGVDDALRAHATDHVSEIRQSILAAIEGYLDAERASDDITLMVLRRTA